MRFFPALLLLASVAASAAPTVFSSTVGSVDGSVFTTRDGALSGLMDRLLAGAKDPGPPSLPGSPVGRREAAALLLEEAVAQEASSFKIDAPADEIKALAQKAEKHIAGNKDWKKPAYTAEEIHKMAERKLSAKNLIRIRSESMRGSISDAEAQAYFEKNRVKFGSLPFASFKNNIKAFLAQQQLEERLRSWFEILRRKYKVREDAAEDARG